MTDKKPAKKKPAAKVESADQVTGVGPANPKGGRPKKGAARAHVDARRAKVEVLELAGASIRQIAESLAIDVHTAWDDVQAVRKARRDRYAGTDLDAERDLARERLEEQHRQLQPLARQGDPAAHNALVRIADRKAKLLGLDAPQRLDVTSEVTTVLGAGVDLDELIELARTAPLQDPEAPQE